MKKAHNYINYPADLHEIRDEERAEQETSRICAEKMQYVLEQDFDSKSLLKGFKKREEQN